MALNERSTSSPSDDIDATVDMQIYLVPLTFLSFILICSGNILTIAAIVRDRTLQTRSNAFVASLAAADLVVGIAVFSFALWLMPSVRSLFESAIYICVTQLSNAFMSIFVSIYSMLLVACDRWLIISRPYLHQRLVTKRVIVGAIILPWFFGFIFGFSQFFILDPLQDPPTCAIILLYPEVYYRIIAPICYFLAVVGIFCFYLDIILIARRHGRAIRRQNQVQSLTNTVNVSVGENVQPKMNANLGAPKFNGQHWKAAKMMMTVFGIFFVCWTPRILLNIFVTNHASTTGTLSSDVSIILGLLNSGVNFLVYPLHSHEFRTAFRKIICFRRYH